MEARRVRCQLCDRWFDLAAHGSCPHPDGDGPCGWTPPPPRPRRVRVEEQTMDVDRWSFAHLPAETVDRALDGIREARRSLDEAVFRKGLDERRRALIDVEVGGRL